MGLLGKIKNVLFEEEEIEIPVFKKEEKEVKKEKIVEKPKQSEVMVKEEIKKEKPIVKEVEDDFKEDNERETFKSEPTFQFPVFDEKDFQEPVKTRSAKNDVKPKNTKKKIDFGRFETTEKKEEEHKKFVPSPVISPVYGVLDKNYVKKDLTSKKEVKSKVISVDDVRNKAYGTLEDQIENTINTTVSEFYEEEKPSKTIDELMTQTKEEEPIIDNEEVNEVPEESLAVLDEIEEDIDKTNLEDTLESDLFNLIDSMYTSKEDEK